MKLLIVAEDAQVIIIEDANTHLGDFKYYYINEEQKKEMYGGIKACLQD